MTRTGSPHIVRDVGSSGWPMPARRAPVPYRRAMSRAASQSLGGRPLIIAAFVALFFGGLVVMGVARASKDELPAATAVIELGGASSARN